MRLFGRLFGWFRRKDVYDVYHPGERMIFAYFDGTKEVKADPMELYRKLMEEGPELQADLSVATSTIAGMEKGASAAQFEVVEKVRRIFTIKPYKEGGLTEIEAIDLLLMFFAFCGAVRKKSNRSPILPSSSADSKTSSAAAPLTDKPLDSGSTDSAPSTAEPPPSN